MIFSNSNVELTKVHFCDIGEGGRRTQISIISKDEPDFRVPQHSLIKKNIFGHRWVLTINEAGNKKSKHRLRIVYILVFICIIIAVSFGIFFSIDFSVKLEQTELITNVSIDVSYDHCTCRADEICLKTVEDQRPECKLIADHKDPTGCGGLCKIDLEYCKRIDPDLDVFQCRPLINILNCTEGLFNCGNRCIMASMRCDGIINCSNQADERNCECDPSTHFHCGNSTSCLELSKRCDGKADCWDNFDEINCRNGCPNHKVPCHNGQCVRKENICDGIYHCMDKSDELSGCELHK
ncbi:atrial natriuretic peptide-converting enzyme-like isoform X2 [Photinus pyralis]|uniref:atrial natriuretic peptide-converting enzyme-like isoform X2 n=1 Tax=Photinus pyralis TaxID=7054 RepID=UPI001266EB93|nr:atrial natriuretic peptide-converting enzyme-like isoform X2 [Photinus pyralis]